MKRWQRWFGRRQLDDQLDRELRFHLDQHTAELVARGLNPEEARRQARVALGGPEQVREMCRDARGTRWLDDLLRDFRYALRTLWQRPGFAAIALLTLALGIGATTVVFTVVSGVLLKPLPYPDPDRLVTVDEQTANGGDPRWGNIWAFSYLNFLDCKRESRSLEMAAWRYGGGTVTEPGEAEHVDGFQVSSGLFSVLGVGLERGRAFMPEEDRPGAAPVIIISHGLWQRRYGASPAVLGMPLVFEAKSYMVVGVAPAGLRLAGDEVDVFTPIGQDTAPNMHNRKAHPRISVLARLDPGVALGQAQAELALIGRHLADRYPESNAGRTFVAKPLRPEVGDVASTLWVLFGAASMILLIACVNVASLLLARAVSRGRELAMRVALGAGRSRLVRQALTESAVLGLSGGVLGILLAMVGLRPFVALWPGSLPRAEDVRLDWHVLLFAAGISLLSGLVFGLAPALRAPARELEPALRAGGRVAGSSRRLHSGFVISEIALAMVLLVSAGMLGRSLLVLASLAPGFDLDNVLVARAALAPGSLRDPEQIRTAWQDALERLRRVPGVQSVATVDTVPMREGDNELGYWTTAALPPAGDQPVSLATCVTPDYLNVMGIPLRRGRFFNDQDRAGKEPVVVIDEVFAQNAFGAKDPVGNRLWIPAMGSDPVRVVGVVGHVRHWGIARDDEARVRAQFYYPFAQVPDSLLRRWSELMSIAVKTTIPPLTMIEPLRRELRGTAGDQVFYEVRTMEQLVSDSLARQRFLLLLFGVFAGLALLLACVGVYGVLAYLTGQRVPEIGLRMALGASPQNVLRMIMRQMAAIIFVGVVLGTLASAAAGRVLLVLVDGMRPIEPLTLELVILLLAVAALCAGFLPALRASRVDPVSALRQE